MMPPPEPDPMGEMAGMIPDDAVPVDPMLAAQVRKIIREEREYTATSAQGVTRSASLSDSLSAWRTARSFAT